MILMDLVTISDNSLNRVNQQLISKIISSTTISKESTLQVNNGNGNSKNPIISDYDIVSSM